MQGIKEGYIICINNPDVSVALTQIDKTEQELKDAIVEYVSVKVQNDIIRKDELLHRMCKDFEGNQKEFESFGGDSKNIANDFCKLVNNFDLRHQNKKGKNRKEYIVTLPKEELEYWYDNAFIMYLHYLTNFNYKTELREIIKNLKLDDKYEFENKN